MSDIPDDVTVESDGDDNYLWKVSATIDPVGSRPGVHSAIDAWVEVWGPTNRGVLPFVGFRPSPWSDRRGSKLLRKYFDFAVMSGYAGAAWTFLDPRRTSGPDRAADRSIRSRSSVPPSGGDHEARLRAVWADVLVPGSVTVCVWGSAACANGWSVDRIRRFGEAASVAGSRLVSFTDRAGTGWGVPTISLELSRFDLDSQVAAVSAGWAR